MLNSEDFYLLKQVLNKNLLKQALNKNSELVQENIRTNRILSITNLISAGVLTQEQALNDETYREFFKTMMNGKDNSNPIKANVRR